MFDRSRRSLAYWFTLSMGSIIILFAFTIYQRQVIEQKREFDDRISVRAKKIALLTTYKRQRKSWQIDTENVSLLNREINPESNIICIRWYDSAKRLLEFIGQCSKQQYEAVPGWQTVKYSCDRHESERQIYARILTLTLKNDKFPVGYLQVTTSLKSINNSLARSRLFLSLGIPITLSFTGIVGWLLAGLAMQPVRRSYEQLQRFTADASHELRAPVAAILSNAQVGLLAPPEDTLQPRQRLENIVTQSKYMSALIANLLFLARHQGQLNPQDLRKTNMVELLTFLATEYQTLASEQGLKFQADIPSRQDSGADKLPRYSFVDPKLLQQAIRNLLDNAIKYTSAPGVVKLKLEVKPRQIIIRVQDTGIGIPAADLPHIFERFYRVDKARTRHTGGCGLGLAISQQIIQAHQGKITAESTLEEGTTFEICLPLRSEI